MWIQILPHDSVKPGQLPYSVRGLIEKELDRLVRETSVDYLGYCIDTEGLHPLPDKAQAVKEPTPTCLTELKSYLGLSIHYANNLATHLAPPYKLLGKDVLGSGGCHRRKRFMTRKIADFV